MKDTLNSIGHAFVDALHKAELSADAAAVRRSDAQKVHVSGAGRTLTFAYEQLRNAAEYTEEHLLLQRAIRRFYKRLFLTHDMGRVQTSGEELVVELTLAGYLENDSVAVETIETINTLASQYYSVHLQRNKEKWSVDVLAVELERLLNDDGKQTVFAQFAYDYFLDTIDQKSTLGKTTPDFEVLLFVAVGRALLKSDQATIRAGLLRRYQQTPVSSTYIKTNEMIDGVLESNWLEKVYRVVDRRGAPFRILWRLIDEHENAAQLFHSREQFLTSYETQVANEYSRVDRRINRGILKSVLFLIITKVIIGVSIEIPYDYLVHGSIVWLPLAINLLFPPIYMVLLRVTLAQPGQMNTRTLTDTIDHLLYSDTHTKMLSQRPSQGFGTAFNIFYGTLFILVFGGVTWWLVNLGFSPLHILIFFVFLSTASFLGFRLSRQIREIEVVQGQQNGVSLVRDFLYIPFVVVGRWMSERYARLNIVATILDMVIELPLKTVLHLIRQWGAFITTKKDEL